MPKSPKEKISPRITASSKEFYEEHFDTLNQGAQYALDAFPALYQLTLVREIRGKFSLAELLAMMDVINSTILTPQAAGQTIDLEIEDAIDMEALTEKWNIKSGVRFVVALRRLTYFQRACLEIYVKAFWAQPDYSAPGMMEQWASRIAKQEKP